MLHLTVENFEKEVKESQGIIVVMFYAAWCGKCAMMKPVAEDIEKRNKNKIKFCEVEIEESGGLAAKYEADIVPTFVIFKNGSVEAVMQGIVEEYEFEQRIQKIFRNS